MVRRHQAFSEECIPKNYFSYFSSKTYVVGTQKNRLNETVLLSTQNICSNWWIRKYLKFYSQNFCLSKPMRHPLSLCQIHMVPYKYGIPALFMLFMDQCYNNFFFYWGLLCLWNTIWQNVIKIDSFQWYQPRKYLLQSSNMSSSI